MAEADEGNLGKLIEDYIASARERIESAEHLLKIENFRDSISRAYYAFLDAADAVLLTRNVRPKSHAGTISQFSLYFIKTNIFEQKFIRWFKRIERARLEADYERQKTFTKEDAGEALKEAKEFVDAVASYIQESN